MPLTGLAESELEVLITDKYLLAPATAVNEPTITVLLGVSTRFIGAVGGVIQAAKDAVVELFFSGFSSR